MKIKEIIHQHRRDFVAMFECEHCKHQEQMRGYDDANYHVNVVPNMECRICKKTSPENYRPLATKYPEGFHI